MCRKTRQSWQFQSLVHRRFHAPLHPIVLMAGLTVSMASTPLLAADPSVPPNERKSKPAAPANSTESAKDAQSSATNSQTAEGKDSAVVQSTPKLTYADERRLTRARGMAERLSHQSTESFERGLMSLPDYANHLATALRIRLTLADVHNDHAAQIVAMSDYAGLLHEAADRLQRFRQPASEGWAADVVLARLMAANADLESAKVQENTSDVVTMSRISADLAQEHWNLRCADYRMGIATLPQIALAASFLGPGAPARFDSGENIRRSVSYETTVENVLEQTEAGAEAGARFGRADDLWLARAELSRFEAMLLHRQGDDKGALKSLNQASEFVQQAYDAQREFQKTGTATLYDLAHTWQIQEELMGHIGTITKEIPEGLRLQQRDALKQLLQVADKTTDLRGRNAADVSLVHSFAALTELTKWQESRRPSNAPPVKSPTAEPDSGK